jgi:hypothetical protein
VSGQSESAVNRAVSLTDDQTRVVSHHEFSVLEESVKVAPKRQDFLVTTQWRDTEGTTRTRVHQRLKVHREDKRPTFPRWPRTRTPSMG